jgi:hypothetical protein
MGFKVKIFGSVQRFVFISIFPLFFLVMTGCATNRSQVSIQQPSAVAQVQPNGKRVFIKVVTDSRQFQEKPKTQDIPSLGFEGSSAATEEAKKQAIGRKRNTFGKAMGDIFLDKGQTVETVIAGTLQQAFSDMGYNIVKNEQEAYGDALVITAKIESFWTYMTPGMWAIKLSCNISTQVNGAIADKNELENITVKAEGNYQMATDSNYMEVVQQALSQYVEQVKVKFSHPKWAGR